MIWKNWPYWLKGGIIGFLISLFLIIIAFIITDIELYIWEIVLLLTYYPFTYIILKIFPPSTTAEGAIIYVVWISICVFPFASFLIGAIIGFIIGKIKSRKNENNNKSG